VRNCLEKLADTLKLPNGLVGILHHIEEFNGLSADLEICLNFGTIKVLLSALC